MWFFEVESTIILVTIIHVFLGPTKKSPTFKVKKNIVIIKIKYNLSEDVSLWEQPQAKNQKRIKQLSLPRYVFNLTRTIQM